MNVRMYEKQNELQKIKRKQIAPRLKEENVQKIDDLIEHFKKGLPVGKISQQDIVDMAIEKLYEEYM